MSDRVIRPSTRRQLRRHGSWLALAACIGMTLTGFSTRLIAQNRNAGEITGTVTDASGAVLPGVLVDALNTDTGQVTHGTTNGSGIYNLPYVPTGPYSVTFTKEGFDKSSQNNIVLHVESITLDVKLQVGTVATVMQVDATNAALLETETSDVNLTLSPQQLTELPNVGGDWKYMTSLLPGVSPGRYQNGTGAGLASTFYVSINGAQADQYGVLLDGGVSASIRSIDPGQTEPPLDAIAELNVTTGLFGAESGNGTAAFNVISKSGTNRFHGSIWEGIQNDAFEAKPYQNSAKIAPLRWNQYGATIGGPFVRNRLFFFYAFQRNPIKQPGSGFYTVPEDAVRGIGTPNGDAFFDPSIYATIYDPATETVVNGVKTRQPFPNNTIPKARFDPVAVNIFQYFPRPNEPYTNGNNYIFSASAPTLNMLHNYRVDYDTSNVNRISASGNYSIQTYVNPYPANPSGYFNYVQGSNNLVGQITDAWTISSSLLNEARFSVFHQDSSWSTPDTKVNNKLGLGNAPFDVFPFINIYGGARTPYGINGQLFAVIRDNTYSAADSVTWSLGKHSLKFGGEWNKSTDDFAWQPISSGSFNFSGVATLNPNLDSAAGAANPVGGSGLADFLLGTAASYGNSVPIIPRLNILNWQAYAQDYFKALPNLTLNFGLRFLYQGGFSEVAGRFDNFQPDLINPATGTPGAVAFGTGTLGKHMEKAKPFLQPRLGFSYNFKPAWTVRGGFGFYNIPWTANNYAQNEGTGYNSFVNVVAPTNSYEPALQLQNGVPSLIHPSPATLTSDFLNGTGVNYQPYDQPVSHLAEWQLGIQHLIGGYLIDISYIGTNGRDLGFTGDHTQIPRSQLGASIHPYPQFSNVNYLGSNGTSNYNSLQVQSKKQFRNGFIYQLTYTYAKSLDTGTGQGGIGAGAIETYQDAYDPMANYGPSNSDLRHSFSGSTVYELPFGRGKQFLKHGGLVDAVIGGWQLSSAFQLHTGTPVTVTVGSADASGRYSGGQWFANQVGNPKLSHRTQQQWFNVAAFQVPAPNTFGNERRNGIYGPSFNQVDFSAAKKFRIPKLGESTSFEFKVDAFNALNHPNLGLPNASLGSGSTGVIGGGIGNAGGAGSGSGMRALQINGHIRF